MKWAEAPDLQDQMIEIVDRLGFDHINPRRIFCLRSYEAKTRAYARIWAFPKIFQTVLGINAAYVIELVSEKFEKLSDDNKKKVIIHELLHIPRNFSGSLLPHKYGYTRIDKEVEKLFKQIK